jgi:hypothetical protein
MPMATFYNFGYILSLEEEVVQLINGFNHIGGVMNSMIGFEYGRSWVRAPVRLNQ